MRTRPEFPIQDDFDSTAGGGLPSLSQLEEELAASFKDVETSTLQKMAVTGLRVVHYPPTLQIFLETLPERLQVLVVNAFLVLAKAELESRRGTA